MAINQNHLFEELNGVKCAIVEKNASPARVDFLRRILEYNRYTVVVVASPPPKAAPAAAVPAAAVPAPTDPVPVPPPETFTVGVTDVMFNPTNAIFGRLLKTPDGHTVTLAYWQQKDTESHDDTPYFATLILSTLLLFVSFFSTAQKFSRAELKEDLDFIQHQIFAVQANPFTELTRQQYEQVFARIRAQLKDSMTSPAFYRLVKPAVSWISDEHAAISLPEKMMPFADSALLLPFSLKKQGPSYFTEALLIPDGRLVPGTAIREINHVAVDQLVRSCMDYTTGFPSQRQEKAMRYFGYLYGLAIAPTQTYTITLANGHEVVVSGVSFTTWRNYINTNNGSGNTCPQMISYTRAGTNGYINACSFATHNDKEYDAVSHAIDSIYDKVRQDSVSELIIDVSRNSGGNSAVGDLLIAGFYDKPYRTYQCNWKRSDEYLTTIKGWGVQNPRYEQVKPGEILHYDADTVFPREGGQRFKGKVYVLIGEGTFSSAIMFATIIKDNHIAPLVGVIPPDGHPTHFGEMYGAKTPHTRLEVRFGVKEWIRPAGKTAENTLVPDIPAALGEPVDIGRLLDTIHTKTGYSPPQAQQRYLYVATPGIRDYLGYGGHGLLVFDINNNHKFIKRIPLRGYHPNAKPSNVKGIAVSIPLNSVYVSTLESLQRIDLRTDSIIWERQIEGGCDRMAISPDGLTMYLPSLENTFWNVVDCKTGDILKKIPVYKRAHNTIYGRAGDVVYLDDIGSPWLFIADARKHELTRKVGPFANFIRPFTVNGKEDKVYVTVDSLLGFEVGDLQKGTKIAHVEVEGWEPGPVRRHGNPSHGIGLTPDEKELWLCDGHNMRLHVFNATPPYQQLTTIPVQDMPGWILFSIDGKYAYPSSGEVIDVRTRRILLTLKDEFNNSVASEKMVEIQFDGKKPLRAGNQFGIGQIF